MPYFKKNDVNILFIHIPKTGGSSCELYFSWKFGIPLNRESLFISTANYSNKDLIDVVSSLQHITYNQIVKNSKVFNIKFDNLKIITIVRNPYERIISDLFFFKIINANSSKMEVFDKLPGYLSSKNYDNHNIPQYIFITDHNKNLVPNIHILKTEKLKTGMNDLGYTDFDRHDHANKDKNKKNYYQYLNNESIHLINTFYHLDFLLFKYDKIVVSPVPVPAVCS